MLVKADTLMVFETGEYSDYTFHGPLRVVKDFDQAATVAAFRAQWKPEYGEDWPDTDQFLGWLTRERYVEAVDNVVSWHIGSYGRLEADPMPEPANT